MNRGTNRRDFLKAGAVVGAGFWISARDSRAQTAATSPSDKLNFACIGVGGKGDSDSDHVGMYGNVVAICDVDDKTLDRKAARFPKAKKYNDFRKLFDEMGKEFDAMTVSIPDHMHAAASLMGMRAGKHVYCQKPLAHTVYEARVMRESAQAYNVKTQMGNQGTAEDGLRRGVEIIRAGGLGKVREVHVWTNRPIWPQAPQITAPPTKVDPIPANIHWDLFLGTAADRPYSSEYEPFKWRGWIDFGTGALGDMGCHTANLAFKALHLEYPTSVVAEGGDVNPYTYPSWASVIYEFPARSEAMPEVKLFWYEGHKPGGKKNLPPQELIDKVIPKPAETESTTQGTQPAKHHRKPDGLTESGLIVVGDEGILYSPNDYGANFHLFPEEKFKDYKDPTPTLPRIGGGDDKHKLEWINAILAGGDAQAMSNFGYAGLLTETILLGNAAIRAGNGNPRKLFWDGPSLRFTNEPQLLKVNYREGWKL